MKISLIHKFFSNLDCNGEKVYSPMSPKLGAYIHQEILRQFKNDITKEIYMKVDTLGYLNQFDKFLKEQKIIVLDVELPVEVNDWPVYLNGSIDMLAADSKGNIGIIEIKCGNMMDSHKHQVSIYAEGLKELPIKFGMLLYLREDHYTEVTRYNDMLKQMISETKELVNNNIGGLLIFEKENSWRSF